MFEGLEGRCFVVFEIKTPIWYVALYVEIASLIRASLRDDV